MGHTPQHRGVFLLSLYMGSYATLGISHANMTESNLQWMQEKRDTMKAPISWHDQEVKGSTHYIKCHGVVVHHILAFHVGP